jgi:hypothetical protein
VEGSRRGGVDEMWFGDVGIESGDKSFRQALAPAAPVPQTDALISTSFHTTARLFTLLSISISYEASWNSSFRAEKTISGAHAATGALPAMSQMPTDAEASCSPEARRRHDHAATHRKEHPGTPYPFLIY